MNPQRSDPKKQISRRKGGGPVVEPGVVLGDAAVGDAAVAVGGEPGDGPFDGGPPPSAFVLPGWAGGGAAGPPVGTAANPQRIELTTKATAINNFVDIGPAGPSPGDLYVFSDDVFCASDPATKVGRADGRCTLIDPSSARFGCTITTSLPKGDITTEGTLINVAGTTSTGAVTGGTADFRNARGEGVLDLGPPEGPHHVTSRLILAP